MSENKSINTARSLDRISGFRFKSKKPEVTRKVFVREKTRIPLILLSAAIAAALFAAGFYLFENAKLAAANREWKAENSKRQERFLNTLESAAATTPQSQIVFVTPAPPAPPPEPAKTLPSRNGGVVAPFTVEQAPNQ